MADAAAAVHGADPDRASFSIALDAARDQVILAAGVTTATTVDLVGRIGERVLAQLMPARRLRTSPRAVKRAISKYNARGNIDRTTRKATVNVEISPAPLTGASVP
jgi:predicted double-glycine peptidase